MTFANESSCRCRTRFNSLGNCHSSSSTSTALVVGSKQQGKHLTHTHTHSLAAERGWMDRLMGLMNDSPKPASLEDVWK